MKRIFTIAALGIWTVEAFAAQTPVTTITAPASGNVSLRTYNNTYVNPKLSTIESNRLDHETRVSAVESDKADKTAVIRYWSDWPDVSPGNTLAVGTIVAFDGKLYKVTQEFVKTEGATPAALTSYFSEVTGSDYTLPTASADTLGGVKVGDRLTITDGVLSADVQSGGATAINDLTDVDTTGKAEGKLLKFDASGNLVVGTDDTGSGSVPDGTVNGQVLLWSTDQWVASAFPGITAYPGAGIPNSTGSAWGTSYTVDTDLSSVSASDDSLPSAKATKTALDLKANSSSLGTASTLNVGTSPGNVVQLGGACTVGDGTYTDQSTCESNSGQWVGVLSIICDSDTEDCNTKLDLISAYEIDQRIAVKQDAMGADDNYVTDAEKIKLANLSGTNTGDQDLSGYALKANVLELTNTTAFTPDADYEPATKKYVDDAVTAGGGYTDEQAQDAWGALLSGGTQTGISVTYNDAGGTANFVVSESDPVFMAWDKSTGISITKSQVSDFGSYAPPLGADDNYVTDAEKTKIAGIAEGAEVNVNADWNSSSGDSQILNKPTIPTVSTATYNTSTWDASTSAPDQNALRDYLINFDSDGDGDFTDEAWFSTGSSMVYPGAGIPNSTGSAWGTSYSLVTTVGATGVDTNIPSEQAVRESLNLKADIENIAFLAGALTDLKIKTTAQPTNGEPLIDDTVTYGATDDNLRLWSIDKVGSELAGKAAASCFADAASFNACFALDWPTDYLTSTNLVTGSTDNAVIRADGTGGKTTQASGVTIDDSDNLTTTGTLKGKTAIVVNSDTSSYSVTQAHARANTLFLTTNAATTTYTLPAAEAGMIVCFKMGQGNSQILRIDTDGTDYIVKSTGTRTSAAGDYYGATASATNRICVAAYDTTDWYVESEVGTWTEE